MPVETLKTFADLLNFLTERRAPYQADMALQLIEMPAKAPPLDDLLYVRWDKRWPYVQIVQPVVRNVFFDRTKQVMEALCRLNDHLPCADFGLEPERRFIYLRRCLPVYEEGLWASWFERELRVVTALARELYRPLRQVVAGAPGASIIELSDAERSHTAP
jgi:hypothetical protein